MSKRMIDSEVADKIKYSYDDMIIVVDEYIRRGAVLYPEWMDIIKL